MARAEFYMEKRGGTLRWCGDAQRRLYEAYVSGLPDSQIVEVVFAKRKHDKTMPQLGYWYAVLMPFAAKELRAAGHDELFEVAIGDLKTGVATTDQTTDLLFKTLFAAHKQMPYMRKRDMTDETMSQLIDFTLAWLAKNLGAVAPQPETSNGVF